MRNIMKLGVALWLATIFLSGCVTSTVVNLTPESYSRNDTGLYRVEATWRSNQQSLRGDSLTSYVVIDTIKYPMRLVENSYDRWETLIPVSEARTYVNYHFQFDFEYNRFPEKGKDSRLSTVFLLTISEP